MFSMRAGCRTAHLVTGNGVKIEIKGPRDTIQASFNDLDQGHEPKHV